MFELNQKTAEQLRMIFLHIRGYFEKKNTDTNIATANYIQSQQLVKSVHNGHFGQHKHFSIKRLSIRESFSP